MSPRSESWRPPTKRWIARGLLYTCLISAAITLLSLRWSFGWIGTTRSTILGRGVLWTVDSQFAPAGFRAGFRSVRPIPGAWNIDLSELGPGYRLSMNRVQPGAWLFPLWTIPAATAPITVALWVWGRRPAPHLCPQCRYDVRGVPASTDGPIVCPECGARHVLFSAACAAASRAIGTRNGEHET
jgi:hypothetical protein